MHGAINWEKHRRKLDGMSGINPYHNQLGNTQPPTEAQIIYINDLISELESMGIEAKWVLEDRPYLRFRREAVLTIRQLRKLKIDKGLYKPSRTEYVNLCRHKETGKKIKYRTSKFCSAPKGYEFIGQLSKETIWEE